MRTRLAVTVAIMAALSLSLTLADGPARAGHQSSPYFDLGALPEIDYSGDQIFEGLKSFVNAYPYRLTGGATEVAAGQFIYDQVRALGYQTAVYSLYGDPDGNVPVEPGAEEVCGPFVNCVGGGLKAVVAIKQGTTRPNEWISFIGHYDTVPQTIYGAYDNGAGTNLINYLAKEFANVPTNRSLAFIWFNGEEEGVLASDLYAEYLKNNGQAITAVFGFDMVGIAWPHNTPATWAPNTCLCMWHGSLSNPGNVPFPSLLRHVNFDFLGFPEGLRMVRIMGVNSRNSDESSFNAQGYPTLRWAGMRTAGSYPAYHLPDDTIEKIIEVAGGETFYEAGIENTMKSAYYTALAIDNHLPVPQAAASTNGLTASLDASGSSDEDGALSVYAWDFGDGTLGTGATADHTYAEPGTYTVTLTVADNLWTDVTRSVAIDVTV